MLRRLFSGTLALLRFLLRRDRLRIPAWLLGVAGLTVICVPLFADLFGDPQEIQSVGEMMQNPAMVAMLGPPYGLDNYHIGAMYANMMLVMMALFAGIMNVFLVTRHTRQDEELGRLEVIRSLPVGRLSNLAATLLAALKVNGAMALLIGLGMAAFGVESVTLGGSMLFGAAMGAAGLVFAGVTAVFCQISSNNRSASGLSLAFLMGVYLLRGVGDVAWEPFALLSPLGIISRTQAFVGNYWWPVLILLGGFVLFALIALVFARARDLGQGMAAARPGRGSGGPQLSGPLGLALRLSRGTLLAWGAGFLLVGVMYGSIVNEMGAFIAGSEMLQMMFAMGAGDGASYTEEFVGALMVVLSIVATISVLGLMLRLRGEEKQGFTEQVLSGSVSRGGLFGSYFGIALVGGALFQLFAALSFWGTASLVMDTPQILGEYMATAMSYLPAMWVFLGLSALLIGCFPKGTGFTYGYLGVSFFVVYMGGLVGFPDWVLILTPFGNIPRLPLAAGDVWPPLILTAIAILLSALGFAGYRRRDMQSG